MKVLFLMFAFPDMEKSFNMYTTIVEEFHSNGHEVKVVAPLMGKGKTKLKNEKGIPVLRVSTLPIKNVHYLIKGISNIFLPFQFSRAIKKYYKDETFDLIVLPTPPITLSKLASNLKRKYNSRLYLILRDIFPQNAIDMGWMKKGGNMYRYFRNLERRLYDKSDKIGCMSPANIDYIKKHNDIASGKLHILENFQKPFLETNLEEIQIKKKYNIEGKFTVVFGGNMGKPQQIENVLVLAEYCKKYEDVLFLLLGEGTYVEKLKKEIKDRQLYNTRIIGTVAKAEYQKLISVCEIGLISLHKDFTIPNIPSKTLDYFNVGIPVLASIDKATDFNDILDISHSGVWAYSGYDDDLTNKFDLLYKDQNLRRELGNNGKKYFSQNLLPSKAYYTIISNIS